MTTRTQSRKSRTVTQKDIAKAAGVSPALVSYVINDGPLPVAEKTKHRVLQAIKDLGYRPNKYAQGLRSRTSPAEHQIGIIIGGQGEILMRPYYGDILFGIYEEAYRQGQHIRFVHFLAELQEPRLFNTYIHPEEISAVIILAPDVAPENSQHHELLRQVLERIENVVCVEQAIANVPAVIIDRIDTARTAVTHLITLGHQRIGFVGNADPRLTGYRQTLLDHGLPYDERLVRHPGLHNTPQDGYAGALQLLELSPRPTAIFATCDEVAIGILGALSDRDVRVPEEIALVSIDDLDVAAVVRPALTTVHIPRRQLGIHALRMIAMHTAYPDSHPAAMVLTTELIVRHSCGAKKA